MSHRRILILGGTGEGFALAAELAGREGLEVISSMAGRTPAPKVPVGAVRRGGFGGVAGLDAYLRENRISAVIDATHPFADKISRNAALACKAADVPCVHLWRPSWERQVGDDWREVASVADAADVIPAGARGVFLTTGKTELAPFAHRDDVEFIARMVAPLSDEEGLLPRPQKLSFVFDRGPFDLDAERALLREHAILLIVTKNSGGSAAYAKLEAARGLQIPVIMVRRPAAPTGELVSTVEEALDWFGAREEVLI